MLGRPFESEKPIIQIDSSVLIRPTTESMLPTQSEVENDPLQLLRGANLSDSELHDEALKSQQIAELILDDTALRNQLGRYIIDIAVAFESVAMKIFKSDHLLNVIIKNYSYYNPTIKIASAHLNVAIAVFTNANIKKHFDRIELCLLRLAHAGQNNFGMLKENMKPFIAYLSNPNGEVDKDKFYQDVIAAHLTRDELIALAQKNEIIAKIIIADPRLHSILKPSDVPGYYHLVQAIPQLITKPQNKISFSAMSSYDLGTLSKEEVEIALSDLSSVEKNIDDFAIHRWANVSSEYCITLLNYEKFAKFFSGEKLQDLIDKYGSSITDTCWGNPVCATKLKAYSAVFNFKINDGIPTLISNLNAAGLTKDNMASIIRKNEAVALALLDPQCASFRKSYDLVCATDDYPSVAKRFTEIPDLEKTLVDYSFRIKYLTKYLPICIYILNSPQLSAHIHGKELYELCMTHKSGLTECIIKNHKAFQALWAYCLLEKGIPSTEKYSDSDQNNQALKYYLLARIYQRHHIALLAERARSYYSYDCTQDNTFLSIAMYHFQIAASLGHDLALQELLNYGDSIPKDYYLGIANIFNDSTRPAIHNPFQANAWHYKALREMMPEAVEPIRQYIFTQGLNGQPDVLRDDKNFKALNWYAEQKNYAEKQNIHRLLINTCLDLNCGSLALVYLQFMSAETARSLLNNKKECLASLIQTAPINEIPYLYDLMHQSDSLTPELNTVLAERMQIIVNAWIKFLKDLQTDFTFYHKDTCGLFASKFFAHKETLSQTLQEYEQRIQSDPATCYRLINSLDTDFSNFVNKLIKGRSKRYLGNFCKFLDYNGKPTIAKDMDFFKLISAKVMKNVVIQASIPRLA